MRHMDDREAGERSWQAMYVAGAIAALVFVAGSLLDIVLTMLPGWGTASVPAAAGAWFAQLASAPLLGIRNLDFLNITLSLIALPLYAALFGAHRRREPALALVALVLVAVGTVLFVANNAALPMLELSRRWAVAAGPAERAALEGAAEALLSRGAHGSFGAFLGFFVSEIGTLLMAVAMLRGRVFGRAAALAGIVGASVLAVYTTAMTFAPASALVMAVAIPGGLLMIAWDVMVARTLLRLARGDSPG